MGTILALDVALQHTGWAIVKPHLYKLPEELVAGGCIDTKPLKSDPNKGAGMIRRVAEIVAELDGVFTAHRPHLMVAELPYGSQHANSAVAQGICYGILGAIRQGTCIPLEAVTPYAGKAAATGSMKASKEQVQDAIMETWPVVGTWEGYEHICDALAALLAARTSDLYRMVRQGGEGGE